MIPFHTVRRASARERGKDSEQGPEGVAVAADQHNQGQLQRPCDESGLMVKGLQAWFKGLRA